MFYQQPPPQYQNQSREEYFELQKNKGLYIQLHMHDYYELFCCETGHAEVVIAGREYVLSPGDAVLIFPYQPHSYPKNREGYGHRSTFAQELVSLFASSYRNCVPKDNLFRFSYDVSELEDSSSIYAIKAFLYSMCAQASAQLVFEADSVGSRMLLEEIFTITENKYTDPTFSLRTLAEILTYDYGYISKYFVIKTGMKFNYYLNLRRISLAGDMIRHDHTTNVETLSYSCGYSTVRSFNRNFKSIYGVTPREYAIQKSGKR